MYYSKTRYAKPEIETETTIDVEYIGPKPFVSIPIVDEQATQFDERGVY